MPDYGRRFQMSRCWHRLNLQVCAITLLQLLSQLSEAKLKLSDLNQATDCSFDILSTEKKEGNFSSKHFPRPYDADETCRYNFQGQGRERVQIEFNTLDLYYPSGDPTDPYDCEDVDAVIVSVMINDERRDVGVYCGKKLPPKLMSNGNRMEVTFISRSARAPHNTQGFQATYRFVEDFGIGNGERSREVVCGFIYRSSQGANGTFTSPNYPGLYPRNTECHYLFYGSDNERVHISFPFFDVEGIPPSCLEDTQSDYVEFANFDIGLVDRKMQRFCGTADDKRLQDDIVSDGSYFRVTFKSNDIYDATGFKGQYRFKEYQSDTWTPGKGPGKGRHTGKANTITPTLFISLLNPVMALLLSSASSL